MAYRIVENQWVRHQTHVSTLEPGLCEETTNSPVIFTLSAGISPSLTGPRAQGLSRLTFFSGWVLWILAGGTHPARVEGGAWC